MFEKALSLSDITMQFGGVVAVNDLTMEVKKGEIVGLIGPNGAGKTTVFNAITGVYPPTNGEVKVFDKRALVNYPKGKLRSRYLGKNKDKYKETLEQSADKITKLGVARTFQNIRLFSKMTVLENVLVAMHMHTQASMFEMILGSKRAKKEEKENREQALKLLKTLDLYENRDDISVSLPYGKQRHLEIARALAAKPKLLLLDEPAAGMNPQESDELMHFIARIRDEFELSILMIEHHMQVIMGVCDTIYVLDHGTLIAKGTPSEIQNNAKVIEAYLGVD